MHRLAALTLVAALAGGLTACTQREEKQMRRAWSDATGRYFQRVDLNEGSRRELADVPGLTQADADRIIAHRPYGTVRGLLNKNVLSKEKFDQVRDYLYVD